MYPTGRYVSVVSIDVRPLKRVKSATKDTLIKLERTSNPLEDSALTKRLEEFSKKLKWPNVDHTTVMIRGEHQVFTPAFRARGVSTLVLAQQCGASKKERMQALADKFEAVTGLRIYERAVTAVTWDISPFKTVRRLSACPLNTNDDPSVTLTCDAKHSYNTVELANNLVLSPEACHAFNAANKIILCGGVCVPRALESLVIPMVNVVVQVQCEPVETNQLAVQALLLSGKVSGRLTVTEFASKPGCAWKLIGDQKMRAVAPEFIDLHRAPKATAGFLASSMHARLDFSKTKTITLCFNSQHYRTQRLRIKTLFDTIMRSDTMVLQSIMLNATHTHSYRALCICLATLLYAAHRDVPGAGYFQLLVMSKQPDPTFASFMDSIRHVLGAAESTRRNLCAQEVGKLDADGKVDDPRYAMMCAIIHNALANKTVYVPCAGDVPATAMGSVNAMFSNRHLDFATGFNVRGWTTNSTKIYVTNTRYVKIECVQLSA
jgi:hypothetical protein